MRKRKNINELSDRDKLSIARGFFQAAPFSTKVYLAMQTGLDMAFILKNWKEISK